MMELMSTKELMYWEYRKLAPMCQPLTVKEFREFVEKFKKEITMNREMVAFARGSIKEGLKLVTEKQQIRFKRMYSHLNLNKPLKEIVDSISEEELSRVLTQVNNTIKKNKDKND